MLRNIIEYASFNQLNFHTHNLTSRISIKIAKGSIVKNPTKNPKRKNGFLELIDAMSFLRKEPVVLVLSLLKSGLAVAGGIMTLIPLMADQVLSKPSMLSFGIGFLYSARGLGAALGPLLVKKFFGETAKVLHW